MIEHDLTIMEGAGYTWRFMLKDADGEILPPAGFVIYGAAACPYREPRVMRVEEADGVVTVTMPGLPRDEAYPWSYQIFVREKITGVEWLLAHGAVHPVERVAGDCGAMSALWQDFVAVLDGCTHEVGIELGDGAIVAARAAEAAEASRMAAASASELAANAALRAEAAKEAAEGAATGAAEEKMEAAAAAAEAVEHAEAAQDAQKEAEAAAENAEEYAASSEGSARQAVAAAADAGTSSKAAADAASDALAAADAARAEVERLQVIEGPPGPQGPQGEPGPQGEQGPQGEPGDSVEFDTAPKSGSTNAVTSGGLYSILFTRDVKIGLNAQVASWGTVVGCGAKTTGFRGVALGEYAEACVDGSIAVGSYAKAMKAKGTAIGRAVTLKDEAVTAIGNQTASGTSQTIFYIIAAGSDLANTYENGAACLGYVVKDSSGNILECGTRKLSELLTNNTTFAPAAMDLDAPTPTPFLPTGIMEPIEEPNMEEYEF